jgi:hypothetical protein
VLHPSSQWLLAAVVAVGCGSAPQEPPPPESRCPRISGKFTATTTLMETQGSCGDAKATSVDPMEFDAQGFVSPVGDLAECATHQADCTLAVVCTTGLINARLEFSGTLSTDGRELHGTAVFAGSFRGCSRVVYALRAVASE